VTAREGERLRRGEQNAGEAIDQIAITYEFKNGKPSARRRVRRLLRRRGRPQGELTRACIRAVVSVFVALEGVSHAYGGATKHACPVEGLSIASNSRAAAAGRAFRLRQIRR
jgi:hypothetical protein